MAQDKGPGSSDDPDQVKKMQKLRLHLEETDGKPQADAQGAKRAVTGAMQSLEEMELSFKRDIKKRKLEVEQSTISETDDSGTHAYMPTKLTSDVLRLDGLLLTPEREACEAGTAVEEGRSWEPAMADEAEAGEDEPLDVAERGAKRSPPVNSDYLPLPWKGRLGYVSNFLALPRLHALLTLAS